MASFKTLDGRTWTIELRHAHHAAVKAACGVDLYRLFEKNLAGLGELLSDPPSLVEVVYNVMTGTTLDKPTREEFASQLDGPTVEGLTSAFVESLAPFSPNRERRELLPKILAKTKEVCSLLATELAEREKNLTPAMLLELMKSPAPTLKETSTSLPANAA